MRTETTWTPVSSRRSCATTRSSCAIVSAVGSASSKTYAARLPCSPSSVWQKSRSAKSSPLTSVVWSQCAAHGRSFFLKQADDSNVSSGLVTLGKDSWLKNGGIIEQPYLDGKQHTAVPIPGFRSIDSL